MAKATVPLVLPVACRTNSLTKDSKMVNCYKETVAGKALLVKRPGKSNFPLSPSLVADGQGLWSYNGGLYALSNGTLYRINTGNAVVKGSGFNPSNNISWVNTATTTSPHPYMVFHDKVNGYYLDSQDNLFNIGQIVGQVVLNSGGTGYPDTGTFSVAGATGTGCIGTYTASAGIITTISMTSGGSGYTGNLVVTFSGAGTSATASAAINSFPANPVSGLVYLNGYVFAMDSKGQIWQSNYEDPSVWLGLNYITAYGEPDGAIGIVKHLNYLVAFKEWTTEFFYDNANAVGSVLSNNISARMEMGCASGDSIQQLEQSVIWMASVKEGGRVVCVMDGVSAVTVSTKSIETFLTASNLVGVYSWMYKIPGHTFYGLVLTDQDVTLVYDINEKEWHVWTTSKEFIGGGEGYFECTFVVNYPDNSTTNYVLDAVTGNVYTISPNNYVDPFGPIIVRAVTPRLGFETFKQKSNSEFVILGDALDDTLQVRHTNDDYDTWSSYRDLDLSLEKPALYNLGSFRRRAYEVKYTGLHPLRLSAFEINLTGEIETK